MLNRDQIAHEYAVELIQKERYVSVDFLAITAFDLANAMIAEAENRKNVERPAVLGDDWISVLDRLPKDFSEVIGYVVDGNALVAYWSGDEWYSPNDSVLSVTHWQPLPAPPNQ